MDKKRLRGALVVLVAATGAAITLALWHAALRQADEEAATRFRFRVAEIATALRGRILDYEQVLRGLAGFVAGSDAVEPHEWTRYVEALRLDIAYPGIRSLGYAALEEGAAPRATVRLVAPLDAENRRSLGFDVYSEPLRRAALERAHATREPVATAPLVLVQDHGEARQPALVIYQPVFRDRLLGFVYGSFRVADFTRATAGSPRRLRLRLVDETAGADETLYDSGRSEDGRPRFERTERFTVRGRAWRLEAASLPEFEASVSRERPLFVLGGGALTTLLLTLLAWSLLHTRERARLLARGMAAASERLGLALESSGLAMFHWDLRDGLVHLGPQWMAILGGAPQPVLTPIQKLETLVHPDDLPALREHVRAVLGGASRYRVEIRVRALDGRWKWIETLARVSERDEAGRALRVTGTLGDVTERRAVAELKNAFIASVSHELRTPLTGIVASLALVRAGEAGELPPQAREFVEMAYGNSERLAELINDLLDLERIESGGLRLAMEPVALAPLLARVARLNQAYAARFGARIEVDTVQRDLAASADEDRLVQVITNLVSNACKFSPQDGVVRLRAARAEGRVSISVCDSGPGVPEAFRRRLFGKFEQADHGKPGTGLGLAICKALVERMGGSIRCESVEGEGATFVVELASASPELLPEAPGV